MALTTKLEAVNTMLGVIGESPVNTISGSSLPASVVVALNILDETNREVQSGGWHFNTEFEYPLVRNSSNQFALPNNTLKIDVPIDKYTDLDIVQRGSQLYDRKNHTDVFTEDLDVTITFELDFTAIPEQFRSYVTIKAARKLAVRLLGSSEIETFTLRDEIQSKATAIDSDSESADRTIFDNADVMRVIDR